MTSDAYRPREAFVWIWLPGRTAPVVAGRIHAEDDHFVFTYGRSYLARDDAIPVYAPELPLRGGAIVPEPQLEIANALRDASPDAWGRRVIAHHLAGGRGAANGIADLDELIVCVLPVPAPTTIRVRSSCTMTTRLTKTPEHQEWPVFPPRFRQPPPLAVHIWSFGDSHRIPRPNIRPSPWNQKPPKTSVFSGVSFGCGGRI